MRFIVMAIATTESESAPPPKPEAFVAMQEYNEEAVKAGVLLAAEGLAPTSKGARVKFSGAKRTVVDGPFTETKELVAGFWIWQVRSMDEAIEWAKRCPNPTGEESALELRPVFEAEDFGAEYTPELRAQDERLRSEMEAKKK